MTPMRRPSHTSAPAARRTRLTGDGRQAAVAARAAGRVTDVPDRRSGLPITFNSAS
ncbi:hypothetical protein AB0I69_13110 [Streptomyces sp. NPDC050508]|uniref:hypothetical protein n=1 Tax=Streptomyces sp. NPDC050508 TaxID=3155405 RepID=UPI003448D2EB